jgi:hypothetical protein
MGLIEAALGIEWKYFYCHFAIKDCSVKPGPQGNAQKKGKPTYRQASPKQQ